MDNLQRKNMLLKKLEKRELTKEQFLQACAEWTAEQIESYSFTSLPVKPKEVIAYERIPKEDRFNIDKQYFLDHPQIEAFYQLYSKIMRDNQVLYDWLADCLKRVGEDNKQKIVDKMGEFIQIRKEVIRDA